jgi:hypothetical protein
VHSFFIANFYFCHCERSEAICKTRKHIPSLQEALATTQSNSPSVIARSASLQSRKQSITMNKKSDCLFSITIVFSLCKPPHSIIARSASEVGQERSNLKNACLPSLRAVKNGAAIKKTHKLIACHAHVPLSVIARQSRKHSLHHSRDLMKPYVSYPSLRGRSVTTDEAIQKNIPPSYKSHIFVIASR